MSRVDLLASFHRHAEFMLAPGEEFECIPEQNPKSGDALPRQLVDFDSGDLHFAWSLIRLWTPHVVVAYGYPGYLTIMKGQQSWLNVHQVNHEATGQVRWVCRQWSVLSRDQVGGHVMGSSVDPGRPYIVEVGKPITLAQTPDKSEGPALLDLLMQLFDHGLGDTLTIMDMFEGKVRHDVFGRVHAWYGTTGEPSLVDWSRALYDGVVVIPIITDSETTLEAQ